MRTPLKLLALVLSFTVLGPVLGHAQDKLCVWLYLAQNSAPPAGAKVAPESLHHRLRDVFGFAHYQLMKRQEFTLRGPNPQWFMPLQDFFLRLQLIPGQDDAPELVEYAIYKDGFIVAKGKFEPREDAPLFINGPDFQQGRLILVLKPEPGDDGP